MLSKLHFVLQILTCIVCTISMVFNSLGMYLLKKHFSKEKTQDLILMTLSVTDIVTALGWFAEQILNFYGLLKPTFAWRVVFSLRSGGYLVWYAMMYMLTLDRFMGCNFPFKHRELALKVDIRVSVAAAWIFGIINGIAYCILDTASVFEIYRKYIWVSLDGIYLCLFAVTYTSIFCKINRAVTHRVQPRVKTGQQQFLKIITLILVSFVVLESIPSIINMTLIHLQEDKQRILEQVTILLYTINTMVDPLIYIFLQPKALTFLRKRLRRFCVKRSKVYSFRDIDPKLGLK